MNKQIILTAIIISLLILTFITQIVQHEKIHKKIYEEDGCENVTIKYNFIKATTTCNEINYQKSETAKILNTQNEIIGYNTQTIMMIILTMGLFIGIILIKEKVN